MTGRGAALPALADATRALDARVNGWLGQAVERANAEGAGCDEERLYEELRRAVASPFIGHLVAEALNRDETLAKRRTLLADSIYRDLGLLDAISVHWKDLSAVLRVGDHLVGVDKLGHFFVEGFAYFERAHLDGEGIDAALTWGEGTERSYFGLLTTGIYSNADLTANFDGMRFWLRVTGAGPDPLDPGLFAPGPYVACGSRLPFWERIFVRERGWRIRRPVEMADYVNGAWDEGVNCPIYRSERIASLVRQRMDEVAAAEGAETACPVDTRACAAAREHYGPYARRLLHPACLEARPARPWWRPW